MSQYYAIITDVGNAKISNALALGRTISLTHMAVGDANGNNFLPTPEQKKLVNEKFRAQINSLTIDDDNQNIVIAEFIIPEDVGGFYVRELGVFDNSGNLIAVGNTPESYKPKMTEGSGAQKVMRMHLVTSASDKIELKINPSIVVATIDFVNKTIATKSDKTHNHDTVYSKISHSHAIANVTGLQTALDGKSSTSHGHADLVPTTRKINNKSLSADVSLTATDVGAAPTSHPHTIAQVTGLQTALDGKATTSHGHSNLANTNASNIVVADYLNKLGLKDLGLATNGWHKLPSGLIIQWGQYFGLDNISDVNFPIAYPYKCCVVIASASSNINLSEKNVRATNFSPEKFKMIAYENERPSSWFSIGF